MSRKTGVRIFAVIVISLFVLTSSMPLVGSRSSNTLYPENGSVTMRVETNQPLYVQGEVVKIKVYIINGKNEAVMYPTMIGYSVYNSKGGNGIGYYINIDWICKCLPTFPPQSETLLDPHSRDATFLWNPKDANRKRVAVGIYTIKLSLHGPEISLSSEITVKIYPNPDVYLGTLRSGFFIFY